MRKLKTLLITLIVVLVLITGGVWGYLWYSTQQQVEQIIAAAKPFAEISYDGIEVLPTGSTSVKQIKIIPHFVNDVISIGAIRLNAPNILALLNIRWQLSQGQLPGALSLSIHQLDLPLHGDIVGAKPLPPHQRSPFDDLGTLGCGAVSRFSGNEWQEMGYDRFVGNMKVGYRLDANQMNVYVSSNTQDWATLSLDMGFALISPLTSMTDLATSLTPKLTSLSAILQDDGYNTRRNNYCAVKAGKPINEYIAEHVRLLVERLRANGINPGPGLMTAYQRYLTEGEQITVTAQPPIPIDPAELPLYTAEDVVKLAGLTVKVDDQVVNDLSVEWDTARVTKALGIGAQRTPAEEAAQGTVAPVLPPKPIVIKQSFHPVAVGALSQHIGKIAKLQTRAGASYRGKLETIAEGTVRITIRKSGGSATLNLRSEEITEAQVLY